MLSSRHTLIICVALLAVITPAQSPLTIPLMPGADIQQYVCYALGELEAPKGVNDVIIELEAGTYDAFSCTYAPSDPTVAKHLTIRKAPGSQGEVVITPPTTPTPITCGSTPVMAATFVYLQSHDPFVVTLDGLVLRGWTSFGTFAYSALKIQASNFHAGGRFAPVIKNCTFESNRGDSTAGRYGGICIQMDTAVDAVIDNCTFRYSQDHRGGAIWSYAESGLDLEASDTDLFPNPTIRNCCFEGNSANFLQDSRGGALAFHSSRGLVEGCVFRDNYANHGGGAIYGRFVDGLKIRDCYFEGNVSLNHVGGAIYLNRSAGQMRPAKIYDCKFVGNAAVKAGAACVLNMDSEWVRNEFVGNTVFEGGDNLSASASGLVIRANGDVEGPDRGDLAVYAALTNNLFVENGWDAGAPAGPDARCVVRLATESPKATIVSDFLNNTFANNATRALTISRDLAHGNAGMIVATIRNSAFSRNDSTDHHSDLFTVGNPYILSSFNMVTDWIGGNDFMEDIEFAQGEVTVAGGTLTSCPGTYTRKNYRPMPGSMAVDHGLVDDWLRQRLAGTLDSPPLDLQLGPRLVGPSVDIGAIESQ